MGRFGILRRDMWYAMGYARPSSKMQESTPHKNWQTAWKRGKIVVVDVGPDS